MKKKIIYDFDGTLTPYPITNFKILSECGFIGGGNNKELQKIVIDKMVEKNISIYESFYEQLLEIVEQNGYTLDDKTLSIGSNEIEYNNGVIDFFNLKKENIDNYIVSSSIKCFLDNINIASYFKGIYGTTFKYRRNTIVGIDTLMTNQKKVDVIKEIVRDNNYNNVIYIGDGLTDYEAMEHVKENGGKTILLVENKNDKIIDKMTKVVSYILEKDFSNKELIDKIIK